MQDIRQYAREFRLAARIGATLADRLRLIKATAAFHVGNARHAHAPSGTERYRVQLLGRTHDLWMRTSSGDIFILYEVFLSECYDIPGYDFRDAGLIVDLGANIGLASLYFAGRAPRARLICVEPSPGNADLLRRNLAAIPEATVVEAAAAGTSGTLPFDDDRPAWGGRLSASGRKTVRAVGMADLLQRCAPGERVDLLKIDIEGGELDLFAGDLSWLARVDRIVAELHPPFTFERFRTLLTGHGFAVRDGAGSTPPTAFRVG